MIIGVPKEIKNNEFRVGMTPGGVREFVEHGHSVLVEKMAGVGSSFTDAEYVAAGGELIDTAEEIFARADMIVKVKEPQAVEIERLRPGQILYTYLHLAPDLAQTQGLIKSGAVCIAYETVELPNRSLPLLAPMSEVAGRMAAQVGATYLQKPFGGRGVLMGGVPGVLPAKVVVLGGGVVGTNAAYVAMGMGAHVTIMDVNLDRLRYLDEIWGNRIRTVYSSKHNIETAVYAADLVIGAVLAPGREDAVPHHHGHAAEHEARARSSSTSPSTRVAASRPPMRRRTRTRPTSWTAFSTTASRTCPVRCRTPRRSRSRTRRCATVSPSPNKGWKQAVADDAALAKGVNVLDGKIVYKSVADAHGMNYTPLEKLL